jgi:two-component system LytT family response regulator
MQRSCYFAVESSKISLRAGGIPFAIRLVQTPMHPPKALLIDDEEFARLHLREMLAAIDPSVRIVGEAAEIKSASELIKRGGYDFLFLDVKLGADTGFDLVPEVPADKPIIFVSGYEQHAHRAFEVHALDYLVKPVRASRLTESLNRLREYQSAPRICRVRQAATAPEPTHGPKIDSVALEIDGHTRFVQVSEIALVSTQENYSSIYLVDGTHGFVRRSLKSWVGSLPETDFVRVHRQTLVNLNHILGYHRASPRSLVLRVAGRERPVNVSRQAATALKERLRTHFPH